MSLIPLPLPRRLDLFRVGVVDFEMKPGLRNPDGMKEGALIVLQEGRVRYRLSGVVNHPKLDDDALLLTFRLHLHGCDYVAGYGGTELAVLSSLCIRALGGRYIDVLAAVRWRWPRLPTYSLEGVCRSLGVDSGNRMTSADDALAAWNCLRLAAAEG